MPSEQIQWFPGHMAKTRRMITENVKNVDIIIEVLDARIPYSSRNPELRRLTAGKPMLVLLNKAGLADPNMTKLWVKHLTKKDTYCLPVDCMTGEGIRAIVPTVREILKEKIERNESKGMTGKRLRAMILGIPNVGKSTLINRLVGNNKAKTENRPGVTVDKAWFTGKDGLDLMDMPVTGGKKADGTLMTLAEISNQNSLIAMYNDGIRTLARVLAEQLSGEGENEETR